MDTATLAARVKDAAFLEGDFVLRSGKRSKYYLDKYLFSAQPDILAELGKRFAAYADDVDVIAGPELGAVSLAAATSMASGKPFAIVRKAQKDYGTAKLIEGAPVEGKRVLLVEDIGTTAGAALQAAETLKGAGVNIVRLCFALDRMEGARKNVEAAGFEFNAILSKDDLGI
ncbi:MAG: orotate phosphoribosyltransferase [Phycisphaerae bacterium]|jgi:orotate phosphoribosyltransferase|nr:orotate phosphoribosyltransferase [Phycisphaerae bacterium]